MQPNYTYRIIPPNSNQEIDYEHFYVPEQFAHLPTMDMPSSIVTLIKTFAHKAAAQVCKKEQHEKAIIYFNQCKTDGIIPKQFVSKFKKIFNTPEEAGIKTQALVASIDQEVARLTNLITEATNDYTNRMPRLTIELNPVFQSCGFYITNEQIQHYLDELILTVKAKFIIKQRADKQLKTAKAQKFMEQKEQANMQVTITKKEMTKQLSRISTLEKKLSQMTISIKKAGNGNGPVKKSPKSGPFKKKQDQKKSSNSGKAKATKGRDGNRQNTARNRSSRG